MKTIDSINPTTGELIQSIPVTPLEEINDMVKKSHIAQKTWALTPIEERAALIIKAYDVILEHKPEIAELIHMEMGKTLTEAEREVDYYCGNIKNLTEEVIEALKPTENNDGATITTTYRDPLGVCASITPWNFPLGMPHTLMMPSLLAGNSILFKPSEEVTLIAIKYTELLNSVLPKNVFQIVIGAGEHGKTLVESDVQLITFTGSQLTGQRILESAAKGIKRVLLEMGGKDPLIVLDDANLEDAAKFAANNSFRNAGQVCVSTEKILVDEKVHGEFIQLLNKHAADVKVGHMINSRQKQHVVNQVKDAVKNGAKVSFGELCDDDSNYFSPMILDDVDSNLNIMMDETFGPVTCVTTFKTIEDAIALANKGDYALGAVVFSKDHKKAHGIARKLTAGMVGINRGPGGAKGSPWVGAGKSGYGFHGSKDGHRQFTQTRIVSVPV